MSTKEVKVKSYTRKTKSGKSVIVRAHTTKRNCSDKGCGSGSGEELLKKKSNDANKNLIALYGKEGARYIRQKYAFDGTSRYEDLAASKKADKDVLSEVSAYAKRKKEYKGPKKRTVGGKIYFVEEGGTVTDSRGRKVGPRVSARVLNNKKK